MNNIKSILKKRILLPAAILAMLIIAAPVVVHFVDDQTYLFSPDMLSGSLLLCFDGPNTDADESVGVIHKLDLPTQEQTLFFPRTELPSQNEFIRHFAYAPEYGVLLVSYGKQRASDDGDPTAEETHRYGLYATDGGTFSQKAEPLPFDAFPCRGLYYVDIIKSFCLDYGRGVDIINMSGEFVERIPLRLPSMWEGTYFDWNASFTKFLSGGRDLYLFDVKNDYMGQKRQNKTFYPFFTDKEEQYIVYLSSARSIRKLPYLSWRGSASEVCDLRDLADEIPAMVISPDREYLAICCKNEDPNTNMVSEYSVVIVEIRTGDYVTVYKASYRSDTIVAMQWI
jgi:hypothetical protein